MKFRIEGISTERHVNGKSILRVSSLETGLTFSVRIDSFMLEDVDVVKTVLRRRHDEILQSNASVDCKIEIGSII